MNTHAPALVHGPRKYAFVFSSTEPLASLGVHVLQRRCHIAPEFSDLPVYGVTTIADGGSCRPHALYIGDQWVPLSMVALGLLITKEGPLIGGVGTEICLSLEIHNVAHYPSHFRGAVLLGDWSGLAAELDSPDCCREGTPCRIPTSGGACPGCNYPRAYAHPTSLLDAFLVDQVYVLGTAVQVYPDPGVAPGVVQIVQRDGRLIEYPIPQAPGDSGETSRESADQRLTHLSPRQLRAEFDTPAKILNLSTQARLLEYAATLIRLGASEPRRCGGGPEGSLHELGLSLADGVFALSLGYRGYLDPRSLRALESAMQALTTTSHPQAVMLHPVLHEVRTILSELGSSGAELRDSGSILERSGRVERARSVCAGSLVVAEDRRLITHPWASYAVIRFPSTVSRVRIALLPGEADHVRIYDLRVAVQGSDDGISVLARVPKYGPTLVREGPPIQMAETYTTRYLPGTVLAGRLREGASLDHPYNLSPADLSGGLQIDLGGTLPPLSQLYFVYQVEPGHLFCAIAEPL